MGVPDWKTEINELHAFFEAYFLGKIPKDEIDRVERALARDFTILVGGASGDSPILRDPYVLAGYIERIARSNRCYLAASEPKTCCMPHRSTRRRWPASLPTFRRTFRNNDWLGKPKSPWRPLRLVFASPPI